MSKQEVLTECAPALRPMMVTFFGSPPNSAMLSCTQANSACWSLSPRLSRPSLAVSAEGRNPNAPTR